MMASPTAASDQTFPGPGSTSVGRGVGCARCAETAQGRASAIISSEQRAATFMRRSSGTGARLVHDRQPHEVHELLSRIHSARCLREDQPYNLAARVDPRERAV